MAIAQHHPEKLNASNRGMLRMTDEQREEYASTSERGLPEKKRKISKGKVHWSDKIK